MLDRLQLTTEEIESLTYADRLLFGVLNVLPEEDLREIFDPDLRKRIKAWEA
jgi:hypothetical protein